LKGKFFMAQAAAEAMKARGGGVIVQTGCIWALQAVGATPSSAYSAANAGVHQMVKNLALELAPAKILVNAVVPCCREDSRVQKGVHSRPPARSGYSRLLRHGLYGRHNLRVLVVHHGGDLTGYHSDLIWLPQQNVGLVILTNAIPVGYFAIASDASCLRQGAPADNYPEVGCSSQT
jgi:hypothetical protein